MAVTSFSIAVISNRLRDEVNDQILKCSRFLQYMRKKKGCVVFNAGGADIKFWVRYRESGLGARAVGDFTEPQAEVLDDYQELTMPWCRYARALASSKFQEKRAQNANAADVNWKYVAMQLSSFKQQFQNVFATDINGDGTRQTSRNDVGDPISGLAAWIDDDNTIAGLNRSTAANAFWQAKISSQADFFGDDILSDEPNGLKSMRTAWNNASVGQQTGKSVNDTFTDMREEPSLTYTDQTNYERYENALHGRDRIMIDSPDASYQTLTFKRKPIDWDTFATSGCMYMPCLDYMTLFCTEADGQILSTYGEDNSSIIKKIVVGTQLCMINKKPSTAARLDITG